MSEEPRAYTAEEATEMFLDHIRAMVDYWDTAGNTPGHTQKERLSGLAFSILTLLDGDTTTLPACYVRLEPHESDKEFLQGQGENWFEPGTDLEWPLHERFYKAEK